MELEALISEQLASMNLTGLDQLIDLAGTKENLFNTMSLSEIIKGIVTGDPLFSFQVIFDNLQRIFLSEIYGSILLGVQLVMICIIMGMLTNFSNSFGEETVSNLATMVCSCSVIALSLKSLMDVYVLCSDTVDIMTGTMQVLLPILVPLLIAMGGFASGGALNPMIVGAITIFNSMIQKMILPAIFLSCVFLLVNSLTERDYVKKLAYFMRNFAVFLLGFCITVFSGLTVMQGLVTRTADGMLAKTARYSMDNFVPIVGGFAADSMDMVISCTTIIKNGIGIFGLLFIITLLAFPLIKLLAVALIYKVTAIIIEPIGNKAVSDCINDMGNSIITMAVVVFLSAMMFLIFLSIIIGIGGGRLWG
ncbi:MAG: stage III sporulation protein AE [Anaerovorax sp.]